MPGSSRKRRKRPPRARTVVVAPPAHLPRPKPRKPTRERPKTLSEEFFEADAATRSTLQIGKMTSAERERLNEIAPVYLFHGDDLCRRTANGYEPTGTVARDFSCLRRGREHYNRAHSSSFAV